MTAAVALAQQRANADVYWRPALQQALPSFANLSVYKMVGLVRFSPLLAVHGDGWSRLVPSTSPIAALHKQIHRLRQITMSVEVNAPRGRCEL